MAYFAFMLVAESIASLNVQCFFLIASAFMSLPTVASWIRRSGPPPPPTPPPNRPSSVRSWNRKGKCYILIDLVDAEERQPANY